MKVVKYLFRGLFRFAIAVFCFSIIIENAAPAIEYIKDSHAAAKAGEEFKKEDPEAKAAEMLKKIETLKENSLEVSALADVEEEVLDSVEFIPDIPELDININSLKEENPDILGIISIPACGIYYPLLQGDDNEEYLHADYKGNKNILGSIFLNAGNNLDMDMNCFIYGHNVRPGNSERMFGTLKSIKSSSDKRVFIYTEKKVYIYTVFATVDVANCNSHEGEMFYKDLKSPEAHQGWLLNILDNNNIENMPECEIDLTQTIALSTCAGAAGGDSKFLAVAALTDVINNF